MQSNLVYVLVLLGGLPAAGALASPGGELDPAFGDHGRILLRGPGFEDLRGVDVFVEPGSGRLLVIADGYHGDRLLRFNNDGSLDQGFGNQGTALLDFGEDSTDILDTQWLPDGKLLIAGVLNGFATPANEVRGSALLARMRADGTPDTAFGNGGRVTLQLGGIYESISDILVQADGSLVVYGSTNRSGTAERILARFSRDGQLDAGFGNSDPPGIGTIETAGIDVRHTVIAQLANGKFLICGDGQPLPGLPSSFKLLAVRTHANGFPDSTFGSNGTLLIGGWQDSVEVNACLELGDGYLLFAGATGSGDRQRASTWRLAPDGGLDAGFGTGGTAVLETDAPSAATAVLLMADGGLAIAGTRRKPSGFGSTPWSDLLVARIDPVSGAIDREFGNRGMTAIDFGANGYPSAAVPADIEQQPDGKLVVAGSQIDRYDWYYAFNIAMTRVDPYGAGSNGWAGMTELDISVRPTSGELAVWVRRTGGTSGLLTVDYSTADATATAGQDYVAANGTLAWADGDLSDKLISISVLNAELAANSESFGVVLSNSNGGLAVARTGITICCNSPTDGTPPPGGAAGNRSGGGALGVELWFLLLLIFWRRTDELAF